MICISFQLPSSLLSEEEDISSAFINSKPLPKKKEKQDVDPIEIDIKISRKSSSSSEDSNTWQLLIANSTDRFQLSPIESDVLGRKSHWLDRPRISWKKINESTIKCEKWLKNLN